MTKRRTFSVVASAAVLCVATLVIPAASAHATESTGSVDNLRTGWDPNEPGLSPSAVGASDFGRLFTTALNGQVYAQPLVAGSTVIAATENDYVYGISTVDGSIQWSRNIGPAWPAATIGCGDLTPNIGVTSTPVYDSSTNTVYLAAKVNDGADAQHPHWYLHAMDATSGVERAGFPVTIAGAPSNDPTRPFTPETEAQRPGLLLLNGVVYAGFGSYCDTGPYRGYVVGVSTTKAAITSIWSDESGAANNSAGIWQSGSGLMSDGSGRIFLTTGNGISPPVSAGSSQPAALAESIVRLTVASDGTMSASDFFSPANATTLDLNDTDFGSGGPVELPSAQFGTAAHPHLIVQAGKDGRVYLLDADNLGGRGQGAGGTDNALGQLGPYQGQWGHPAVYGGEGGYVYMISNGGPLRAFSYGLSGSGVPALSQTGATTGTLGYTSGSPIVTSNGTTAGSGLVWVEQTTGPTGANGTLVAYNAVPNSSGKLTVAYSAPIGTTSKFAVPASDSGRVYVGTRDGNLIAFGRPTTSALTASSLDVGSVAVGQKATGSLTLTATRAVNISSVSVPAPWTVTAPTLPTSLAAGASLSLPVSFTPTSPGATSATVTVGTDQGSFGFTVSGTGTRAGLSANPNPVTFTGQPTSSSASQNVQITNTGTVAETITSTSVPAAPFSVSGLPANGTVVGPGSSFVASVTYAPTLAGSNTGNLVVTSTSGTLSIPINATAVTGTGDLVIAPTSLGFGSVPLGQTSTLSFTVSNDGNIPFTISKAKAPAGDFTTSNPLAEGTVLGPDQSITQSVTYAPSVLGAESAVYEITADTGQGAMDVPLTGTGTAALSALPAPNASTWKTNGSATISGGAVTLTTAAQQLRGSAFYATPVTTSGIHATFTATIGSGSGGDGETFALLDPSKSTASSLGVAGGGMGFSGLNGVAVVLNTVWNSKTSSNNFIGLAQGPGGGSDSLTYLSWAVLPTSLRTGSHLIDVTVVGGRIVVRVDGTSYLDVSGLTLPPTSYVGFTGSTGASTDIHTVSGVTITTGNSTPGVALTASPTSVAFGAVTAGTSSGASITLTNNGTQTETVSSTSAPALPFTATMPTISTTVSAGASITVPVAFAPAVAGPASGSLSVTTNDGTVTVTLSGTGIASAPSGTTLPPITDASWTHNGSAALSGTDLVLTKAGASMTAGSSFYSTAVSPTGLSATFTTSISGGTGADGMTFALIDATKDAATAVGVNGGGLGFVGLAGTAVALDTYKSTGDPSSNFVGVTTSTIGQTGSTKYVATSTAVPALRTGTHVFVVSVTSASHITVSVDGTAVLDVPVTLAPSTYVGFTAANGGSTDTHLVRAVSISTSPTVAAHQLPAFGDSTWHANGVASVTNGVATLTPAATQSVAGDLINSTAVAPLGLQATFTESISGTGTTGADGLSIAFLDASAATTTSLGSSGAGVGLAGVPAVAVTLQTYPALGLASSNFLAVATSVSGNPALTAVSSSTAIPTLRGTSHVVAVTITTNSQIAVSIDGTTVLTANVTLPPHVLVAFTGGTGSYTDLHTVSAATVTYTN